MAPNEGEDIDGVPIVDTIADIPGKGETVVPQQVTTVANFLDSQREEFLPDEYSWLPGGVDYAGRFDNWQQVVDEFKPGPAKFEVVEISAPTSVKESETVPVSVTVRNTGDLSGDVEIDAGGSTSVSVEGGGSKTVRFDIKNPTPPSEEIGVIVSSGDSTVGSRSLSVRVDRVKPANFTLTSFNPPLSSEGKNEVSVSLSVKNTGDKPGSVDVIANGNVVESVEINGGGEEQISFRFTGLTPPSEKLSVNLSSGRGVEDSASATIQVPSDSQTEPEPEPEPEPPNIMPEPPSDGGGGGGEIGGIDRRLVAGAAVAVGIGIALSQR